MKPEEKKQLKYKMPLFPFTSYVSLAFLAFVVILMAYSPDTRVAVIIGPIWFLILLAVYYGKGFHKKMRLLPANEISADKKSSSGLFLCVLIENREQERIGMCFCRGCL